MANRLSEIERDKRSKTVLRVRNKGVARAVREVKHKEADARNDITPPERRRAFRNAVKAYNELPGEWEGGYWE